MRTLIARFNRNSNVADFIGVVAVGIFIGYERQRLADSGELIPQKIITSIAISCAAYVIAFAMTRSRRLTVARLPRWATVALSGSITCSFALHVVYYLVANRRYGNDLSTVEYILWLLPDVSVRFVLTSVVYSVVALSVLALIRLCMLPRMSAAGG